MSGGAGAGRPPPPGVSRKDLAGTGATVAVQRITLSNVLTDGLHQHGIAFPSVC